MARVLVTGARGLVGSTVAPFLVSQGHEIVRQSRSARDGYVGIDLTDATATYGALDTVAPDVIINLAAATDVDECERNPGFAYSANALSVENIVRWISKQAMGCHLIQVSTDQVYDGGGPHEESRVCPINYYAFSKYAGELIASRVGATVLRTNVFGRSLCPTRMSLSDWLVSVMRRREPATVFEDVLFSPLSLETLSVMIAMAMNRRLGGVFNLGSRNGLSKADFAFSLGNCMGLPTASLRRVKSNNAPFAARRPKDMRTNSERFESQFGVVLPTLESEINLMEKTYASYA